MDCVTCAYDKCGNCRESKTNILIRMKIKSVAVSKICVIPATIALIGFAHDVQVGSRLRVTPRRLRVTPRLPGSAATTVQHTKNASTTKGEPIKKTSMQQCNNTSRTVLQRGVQQIVRTGIKSSLGVSTYTLLLNMLMPAPIIVLHI